MYPLTEDMPKSLLPIANRPLISYQLELLEQCGFGEAIVVTLESHANKIAKFISEVYKGKIVVSLVLFKEITGTADVLYKIRDKLKTNFIVISGDLILDHTFLHHAVDLHRSRDAAAVLLLKQPTSEQQAQEKAKMAKTKTQEQVFDYIGLDAKKERVVFLTSSADVDEGLRIHKGLLRRYPHMKIYTTLLDSHLYVFSKWVLDLIADDKEKKKNRFSSVKGDFVPYLVACQGSAAKQDSLPPTAKESPQSLALSMSSMHTENTPSGRGSCYASFMENGYCMRVNSLSLYSEVNRDIARSAAVYLPWEPKGKGNFIGENSQIHVQTQVGAECVVGSESKIGERCSVKKSVIGKSCQIGDNVKIANSVLMGHVVIGNNCTITDAIICDNVTIKENCNIKDAQIGVGCQIAAKSDIKNETVTKDRA
jgi:translation initiation factor eIF-2B subunit gamma